MLRKSKKTELDQTTNSAALAFVRSSERCGLGPIVATNKDVGTVNFLWQIARESIITDVGFWKNDAKYEDQGHIVFQRNTLVSQEWFKICINSQRNPEN